MNHHEIWELLPWYVNGRLAETDGRRVEEHLRECVDCRAECQTQRQILQVMAGSSSVEQIPMAGLNKLRARIDGLGSVRAAASPPPLPKTANWRDRRISGTMAACIVGACLVLFVFATAHRMDWRQGESAGYYTVTTPQAAHSDAAIRAVFTPSITLFDLQALLDDAQVRIVSGPTDAGVYSLAKTGSRSVDWSLRRLREHETVRFAEAIARAMPPP